MEDVEMSEVTNDIIFININNSNQSQQTVDFNNQNKLFNYSNNINLAEQINLYNICASKIQALTRGYFTRKYNYQEKDSFNLNTINQMLDAFIEYTKMLHMLNHGLENKKIRSPNFPSEISENIVKFAIRKRYNICPCWDTDSGDLSLFDNKLEVKAYSSDGPSSFGPSEDWNILYFIDCRNYTRKHFKIYEIKLSNLNPIFNSVMVNKKQTFKNQCDEGRRPRLCFSKLRDYLINTGQYMNHCNTIFEGTIDMLL